MRGHLLKLFALLVLAVLLGAGAFGVDWYRHRFVRNDADLLALLPPEDATVIFADVRALRATPWGQFMFSKGDQQADYREFVRETGWDYSRDLQSVALSIGPMTTYGALQGRWDWGALQKYATRHGGRCVRNECSLPGSAPDRLISFAQVQPDVLAVAIGSQREAIQALLSNRGVHGTPVPSDKLWMKIAPHVLRHPENLPVPIQVFLKALQPASDVTLFVRPAVEAHTDRDIVLAMEVIAPDAKTANTVASRLQTQTDSLRTALKQQGHEAQTNDLLGLVTSGSFRSEGRSVVGAWPIHNGLLSQLR